MPLISRFGVNASRGFGELSGAKLVTVTFTSNTNWYAPSNVTNIITLVGKGQNAVSDYTTPNQPVSWCHISNISISFSTGIDPRTYSYDSVYSTFITGRLSAVNTGSGVITVARRSWYSSIYNTGNFGGAGDIGSPSVDFFLSGTQTYVAGTGSVQNPGGQFLTPYVWPTGTQMGYQAGKSSQGAMVVATAYTYGNAGANTTGFGYTFNGGTYVAPTGNPATPVTINNLSVTPGTTYPLVIPSGGYIAITYLA